MLPEIVLAGAETQRVRETHAATAQRNQGAPRPLPAGKDFFPCRNMTAVLPDPGPFPGFRFNRFMQTLLIHSIMRTRRNRGIPRRQHTADSH